LAGNDIGDVGAFELAEAVQHSTHLKELNLDGINKKIYM